MSVTSSARSCSSVTTRPSILGVTLPSKPTLSSFSLAATIPTCFPVVARRRFSYARAPLFSSLGSPLLHDRRLFVSGQPAAISPRQRQRPCKLSRRLVAIFGPLRHQLADHPGNPKRYVVA